MQLFFDHNIHYNNYYFNHHIADHAAGAAAAAAAAAAADGDDGDVDGDSFKFQMLSINMLTMILMSNIITTAITHLPALRCLTPAAAGMDGPPYTGLLVLLKLQSSWSSPRLTWLPSPSEAAAQKLLLLFAMHDCDDDDDDDDDEW